MKSPIDFTLLWDTTEGYAVHCSTEDEANEFFEWVQLLFPGMVKGWEAKENRFFIHKSETIYTFDSNVSFGEWRKSNGLLYGSVEAAKEIGYKVIEFAEICHHSEIEESEMPIELLLS